MSDNPRSPRNFLTTLLVVVAARVAEPFIVRNIEYVIDKRDLDKLLDAVLVAMPDWIGPAIDQLGLRGFWGGAFSVLAIWGCSEIAHAVRRGYGARQQPAAAPGGVFPGGRRIAADASVAVPASAFVVTFHNQTAVPIHLFRTRHDGAADPATVLQPRTAYGALTQDGDRWVAKDALGRELRRYVASTAADRLVKIDDF